MSIVVYPIDRPAYARLRRLLSLGKKRGGKAQCRLDWSDLVAYGEGLIALVPDEADDTCALRLNRLSEAFRKKQPSFARRGFLKRPVPGCSRLAARPR